MIHPTFPRTLMKPVEVEHKRVDYEGELQPADWQIKNNEGWIPWHIEKEEWTVKCTYCRSSFVQKVLWRVWFYRVLVGKKITDKT